MYIDLTKQKKQKNQTKPKAASYEYDNYIKLFSELDNKFTEILDNKFTKELEILKKRIDILESSVKYK